MYKLLSGLLAGVALLVAAPSTLAAPVTVDLRIEGKARTLYEGSVTVDFRPFRFGGDSEHTCDGTSANKGPSPTPVVTRGAVVAQAAEQAPFTTRGTWSDSLGSPSFSEVAGENVSFDGATNRYLVEYKNGAASNLGSS